LFVFPLGLSKLSVVYDIECLSLKLKSLNRLSLLGTDKTALYL